MGKTLSTYFRRFTADEIAQFYIHSEIPTSNICENYFRITDMDIIKSIFSRKRGKAYTKNDIQFGRDNPCTNDSRKISAMYQKGRERSPLIYFARNLIWRLGNWNNKAFNNWIDEFDPDVVFLASGDYSFLYRIALHAAKTRKIPLVISCMDDYYFYNKNENSFMGKVVHKCFMRQVCKTIDYASCLFTICDNMSKDYSEYFKKKNCYTLHTSSTMERKSLHNPTNNISYIGNLGYKRNEQLIELGQALKKIDCDGKPQYIDVYSAEKRSDILVGLTEENGIRFHGEISSDKVHEIMRNSMAVIHTESFDEDMRKRVAYSVSTKIADSLASGTCIFAYGPPEVASMQYLIDNRAAFCITEAEKLEDGLRKLIENEKLRQEFVSNALTLAEKNHDLEKNGKMISKVLENVCSNRSDNDYA